MKIIGVMGGSGSGKSTIAQLLKDNLGETAKVISIDDYMHKYTRIRSRRLLDLFGLEEDDGFLLNHVSETIDTIRNWIGAIADDILNEVREDLASFEGQYSTVILDWAFLPLICSLYRMCDVTIRVRTDYQLKLNRLRVRLAENNKNELWSDEDLRKRIYNSDLEGVDYQPNFILPNDGSFADTRMLVDHFSNILKTMGFAFDEMSM